MPNFLCRLFGHKFSDVIGAGDFALWGYDWTFSHCRRCDTPNPHWTQTADARKHPRKQRWGQPTMSLIAARKERRDA